MIPYSKLSNSEIKKIIQCFCIDVDATKTSKLLGLNGNTIDRYFKLLREIIYLDRRDKFKKKI